MKKAKLQPMYRFLMVLTISSTVGLQVWRTLFNNFSVEVALLDGNHIGIIQSVREVPGLLTLLVIFVLMVIKEHRLSALSILVLGLGVTVTGLFPSFLGLLFTTLIMSIGFHYYETTNQSLTLQYFDKHISPWVLGKMRSYSAASNIAVGILIYLLTSVLNYTQMYFLLGGLICAAGIWGFRQNPIDRDVPLQRKEMIFRKKYWLFYYLTFMGGARRQIFVAFAVFLMVK
ncbi:MAG: MFS transporter, partial [Deltaproteobacteria bacterium]